MIRVFWVLRTFVRCAGALTGQGEDLFFLSIDEILAVLRGDNTSLAYIPARRATHARYFALPPYLALIRGVPNHLYEAIILYSVITSTLFFTICHIGQTDSSAS